MNDSEHTVAIEVKPTRELDQQILSFGPDVEVLSPLHYREHIKEKLEESVKKYVPVQDGCIINS